MKQYPNQDKLHELFEYRDGNLYWKVRLKTNMPIGSRAGTVNSQGYRHIIIDKTRYLEHRLIWIWHNGNASTDLVIDHIDRNKTNNRIENLRIITNSQNLHNRNNSNVSLLNGKSHWKNYMGRVIIDGKLMRKSFHTESEAKTWVENLKNNYLLSIDNQESHDRIEE